MKRMLKFAVLLLSIAVLSGCSSAGKAPYKVSLEKSFVYPADEFNDGMDYLVFNLNVENLLDEEIYDFDIIDAATVKIGDKVLERADLFLNENEAVIETDELAAKEKGVFQIEYKFDYAENVDKEAEIDIHYMEKGHKLSKASVMTEKLKIADLEYLVYESAQKLTIDSVTQTDNGEGADLLVFEMTYTNTSDKGNDYLRGIEMELFQDGVELEQSYLPYNHPLDTDEDNVSKSVKDGASLKVQDVYKLINTTSPVEVVVKDSEGRFDSSIKPILKKTVLFEDSKDIPENTKVLAKKMENKSLFEYEYKNAVIGYDEYTEKPVVLLMGVFKNNSSESITPALAMESKCTQGGSELGTAFISSGYSDYWDEIGPGKEAFVYSAWEVENIDEDVEITIVDSKNYASPEIFSGKYTIDELIANYSKYSDFTDGLENPQTEQLPSDSL